MTAAVEQDDDVEVTLVEVVAGTVAGQPQIGMAQRALTKKGMTAFVCGSRITVDGAVDAQLVSGKWWTVFAHDGESPVWMVGATPEASVTAWEVE